MSDMSTCMYRVRRKSTGPPNSESVCCLYDYKKIKLLGENKIVLKILLSTYPAILTLFALNT